MAGGATSSLGTGGSGGGEGGVTAREISGAGAVNCGECGRDAGGGGDVIAGVATDPADPFD
jgi:hypothetical protein